jgi:hypothetical protein
MEKGIDLQAKVHAGTDPAAASDLKQKLPDVFAATNPGLKLRVKKVSEPDGAGDVTLRVYIEGEQDPAADFSALTRGALEKAIAAYNSAGSAAAGSASTAPSAATSMGAAVTGQAGVQLKDLKEMEGDEEDTDVTLAPQASPQAPSQAPAQASQAAPTTGTGEPAPASPAPAQPSAAPSPTPPPAPSTTQAAGRPWWAFWRRTG